MSETYEEVKRGGSPIPLLAFLGILFIPGVIAAFAVWSLFRYGRQKISVVNLTTLAIGFLGSILLISGVSQVSNALNAPGGIIDNFDKLIPLWLGVSLLIAPPVGAFIASKEAKRMRLYPYLVTLEGSWRYKFKYRRAPWEHARLKKNYKLLESGALIQEDKAPMGIDEDNDSVVFRYDSEARKHTFITGTTGSGKSISMQNLMLADIEAGKTVVLIDFKRSPLFASKAAAWAHEYVRDFYHFVNGKPEDYDIPLSKGQCHYDPLKSGTATSKADMVLGMREYDTSSAVYKTAMQQLLQVLFSMLENADKKTAKSIDWEHGGMYQLASAVGGNGLQELAAACSIEVPPTYPGKKYEYLKPGAGGLSGAAPVFVNSPIAKEAIELVEALRGKGPLQNAQTELQGQIRTIIASEYGRWMKTGAPGAREIDLLKLTSKGGNVIVFSLNSDSEPEFAQYIGSMIFSDLTNISALRRNAGQKNHVSIYVDEFQAVPPTAVTSLLEKSRESALAMTIAQQSFDQVVSSAPQAGEAYLNSILDTCSNFIAHAGATEDSATRLAKILGKHWVTVYSRTNDNDSSMFSKNRRKDMASKVASREEERWIYPPEKFMKLSLPDESNGYRSSMVWVTKTSSDPAYAKKTGATARTVVVKPDHRVLKEYYKGKAIEAKSRPRVLEQPMEAVEAAEASIDLNSIIDFDNLETPAESSPQTFNSDAGYEPIYDESFEAGYEDRPPLDEEDWGFEEVDEPIEDEGISALPLPQAPKPAEQREQARKPQGLPSAPMQKKPGGGLPIPALPPKQEPTPAASPLPDFSDIDSLFKGGAAPPPPKAAEKPKKNSGGLPDLSSIELPKL